MNIKIHINEVGRRTIHIPPAVSGDVYNKINKVFANKFNFNEPGTYWVSIPHPKEWPAFVKKKKGVFRIKKYRNT